MSMQWNVDLILHLQNKNLCGRKKVQSFIEASEKDVKEICRKSGTRLNDKDNLCISNQPMMIYEVTSTKNNNGCTVTKVDPFPAQYVMVACNKVENICRPVHFQTKIQTPKKGKPCMP